MENKTIEESILTALECTDINMLKYMPYILQDFWELGTSAEEVIKVIKKHKSNNSSLSVLDLGSGKGAVSVKIASELGFKCHGIDALEDFVVFSNYMAKINLVRDICTFETDDIRKRIKTLEKYDIIILGAIGPILGDYYSTLLQLSAHINNGGIIIVNDAYTENDQETENPNVLRKSDLVEQINKAGMDLIDIITKSDIPGVSERYRNEFENIQKRCMELVEKYPENRNIFIEYMEGQKREYEVLDNEITPAMLIIKQKV